MFRTTFNLTKSIPVALISAALIMGNASCSNTSSDPSLNTETTLLSDSLDHWHNVYDYGEAALSGDEIHLISTGNWFFLTKKAYSDFELEAEVLMPDVQEYSNSGFIFRAKVGEHDTKGNFAYGYQAEVDPSDRKWSGGLYDQGTPRKWLHPLHDTRSAPDEDFKKNHTFPWDEIKANAYKHLAWNHYRIRAVGPEIKIWVNGVLTTHVIDTKTSEGFIGIQHHGSKSYGDTGDTKNTVRFRNIKVTEL